MEIIHEATPTRKLTFQQLQLEDLPWTSPLHHSGRTTIMTEVEGIKANSSLLSPLRPHPYKYTRT